MTPIDQNRFESVWRRGWASPAADARFWTLLAFMVPFFTYIGSRNTQIWDSQYTMLLAENLLYRGSFDLSERFHGLDIKALPYQLTEINGGIYHTYPPGTAVLAVPYVAIANQFGFSAVDESGRPYRSGERLLQRLFAALVTAGSVLVLFRTAALVLSIRASFLIAMTAAFATQMWSTVSRAMWAHTLSILFLSVLLYLYLRRETIGRRYSPYLVGTLLSWLFFLRPTNVVFIIALTAFCILRDHKLAIPVIGTGALWLAGFLGWSLYEFGTLIPVYYTWGSHMNPEGFSSGLAGTMLSPSRGLLVYTPVTLTCMYMGIRYLRYTRHWQVLFLTLLTTAGFVGLISLWPVWWGGHCFGPRLTSELVPFLTLMFVLGEQARQTRERAMGPSGGLFVWRTMLVSFFVGSGFLIHAMGANFPATAEWNQRIVDANPTILWEWENAQFLAGLETLTR